MKRRNMIVSIIFLVAVDQVMKMIVSFFYMDHTFTITSWFGFHPYLNADQMSIFNNELNLNVDHRILITIEIVLLVLLFLCFVNIEKKYSNFKLVNTAIAMLMAGTVCSLIDLMFWGGSLDYILLFSKIIDLKDVYLFAGGIMFLGLSMVMEIKEHIGKKEKNE